MKRCKTCLALISKGFGNATITGNKVDFKKSKDIDIDEVLKRVSVESLKTNQCKECYEKSNSNRS